MSKETSNLSFKVLNLLSRERAVYGLRNGDHERYRHHCANKLHRLRQSTGLTSGKGKQYKAPAPITPESLTSAKQLQLLLFSAERALAHSHEFKALASKPNAPRTARKDQISWLRKANKYADELLSLAQSADPSRLNAQTLAEISIYALSVKAELSFERAQYAEALSQLAARRQLLGVLASAARNSHDQALALEFQDAYDPLIRFSAYKLGNTQSHDIDAVVADIDADLREEALPGLKKLTERLREETKAGEMEEGRETLQDVTFAGQKIEFRSAEMVDAMLKVQDAKVKMARATSGAAGKSGKGGKGNMRGWDRLLLVLGEAEAVSRRLLEDQALSTSLQSTASQSLAQAHQYVSFDLLSHRIRRDLLLVDSLRGTTNALPADVTQLKLSGRQKTEDAIRALSGIVKLYDAVLQSLSLLRSLPLVEESDGPRRSAEAAESFFSARKNLALARLHCLFPNPNYAAAVDLLTRGKQRVTRAQELLGEKTEEEVVDITPEELEELRKDVDALSLAAKRALFAQTVPKPVFFDSAFNYIDLPMEELLERAGAVQPKAQTKAPAKVEPKKKEVKQEKPKPVQKAPEPQPEEEEDEEEPQQKKGWLGGWFGRG